jgi:SNF family Na+-dependent transporter
LSGFAVWGLIGSLELSKDIPRLDPDELSSHALTFVTLPDAMNNLASSNWWSFCMYFILLLFGIDSAFSFIEGVTTTINDVAFFRGYPRAFISMMVCIVGALCSLVYCFNWGFELLDLVDYYINTFLLVFIGIIQCLGCGWAFDFGVTYEKHQWSASVSLFGYWFCLILISGICIPYQYAGVGGLVFFASQVLIINPLSWYVSGLDFFSWYRQIFFCGVRKIAYSFTKMGRTDDLVVEWWEHIFSFYWSFCIQYMIPAILWFVFIGNIYERAVEERDEAIRWHIASIIILVIGFMFFICPTVLGVYEVSIMEDLFHDEATSYEEDYAKLGDNYLESRGSQLSGGGPTPAGPEIEVAEEQKEEDKPEDDKAEEPVGNPSI